MPHPLRKSFGVAARVRAKNHAAMPPMRSAGASLPGAAGALLPPGLLAATPNFAPRLRIGRPLPGVRLFRYHRLVNQRDAWLHAKHRIRKRQFADIFAIHVVEL